MERAHIFMAGIALVILTAIVVVLGALKFASERPEQKNSDESAAYSTFSAPTNVFESFRRSEDTSPSVIEPNSQATVSERQLAIQNIIRTWEARAGSSDARAARANPSTPVVEKTPEQIEREEISNLFNDLIGTKVTDKLAQQGGFGSSSSGTGGESVWLGGYSNSQGTVLEETQSPTQEALHAYGNELGSLLKTFNLSQGDQSGLLDTFIKNRSDTQSLKRLTDGYVQLSADIAKLEAPAQIASVHSGLVVSYKAVGELLWDLTLATNDEELIERMLIYNKSSEEVAKHHVSLVTLFKAHNIEFQSFEPGSIFSFNPSVQGTF